MRKTFDPSKSAPCTLQICYVIFAGHIVLVLFHRSGVGLESMAVTMEVDNIEPGNASGKDANGGVEKIDVEATTVDGKTKPLF